MGLFNKIEDGIKNAVKGIEKVVGEGVKDAGNAGKFVIDKGTGVISGVEDTLSFPLIAIAVGIGFFLYNSNLGQGADLAKNVAPLAMAA